MCVLVVDSCMAYEHFFNGEIKYLYDRNREGPETTVQMAYEHFFNGEIKYLYDRNREGPETTQISGAKITLTPLELSMSGRKSIPPAMARHSVVTC